MARLGAVATSGTLRDLVTAAMGTGREILGFSGLAMGYITVYAMEAVCLQHEMDHLIGKTLVDRVSMFRRLRIRAAIARRRRAAIRSASTAR